MACSLQDLNFVFNGSKLPEQTQYGGLEQMPDIDKEYRQPQPLLLLGDDNKIYYRTDLNRIEILSPSQLQATSAAPVQHGYSELSNKLEAFMLVFKLRMLPFIYTSQVETPTAEQLVLLEAEENELNPGRRPIPQPPTALGPIPVTVPVWQQPASKHMVTQGIMRNGFLATSGERKRSLEQDSLDIEATLTASSL